MKSKKISGIVITKNLNPREKIHPKIIEGRLIWFLMEPSNFHENQGIKENIDSHQSHINVMKLSYIPRDFLARLSRYFIIDENGLSKFQEFHKIACLILAEIMPHYRKRKLKNTAIVLTMFLILENEAENFGNDLQKKLFVEVFADRQTFIEALAIELRKTDEVEKGMTCGRIMALQSDVFDDESTEMEDVSVEDLVKWLLENEMKMNQSMKLQSS